MATSRPAPEGRRVAVEVIRGCDNHCLFCGREGLEGSDERRALTSAALRERLEAARAEGDEVTFVGGEPTLDADALIDAITQARALGFRAVGLQSHGRRLADGALVDRLVDAGLSDLHLSIHGDAAAVHDYHVGHEGALAAIDGALGEARRRRLVVVATTLLTRSNLRGLAGLPRWLRARGVAGWAIALPRAAGGARSRFEAIVPRLGIALPHALHALELAARLQLPAWIAGAPLCLLGPLRGRALAEAEARGFSAACEGCPARGECGGVDPIYVTRFAGDELAASRLQPTRVDAPHAPARREDALRRLFVGHGRLAEGGRSLASIIDPPRSGAARLQVVEG
ncbi:MAG: radical SAM protein [Myxococcales bacterium]|nr:radical SAM protein [Myxococcales bacterium]